MTKEGTTIRLSSQISWKWCEACKYLNLLNSKTKAPLRTMKVLLKCQPKTWMTRKPGKPGESKWNSGASRWPNNMVVQEVAEEEAAAAEVVEVADGAEVAMASMVGWDRWWGRAAISRTRLKEKITMVSLKELGRALVATRSIEPRL